MDQFRAISEPRDSLPKDVRALIANAYSENTRRAYRSDIASFLRWGGELPSTPDEIARYLTERAKGASVHTIRRHLSALSNLHDAMGILPNPVKTPLVARTMRGATRLYGSAQKAAAPLMVSDLHAIVCTIEAGNVGARDAALLLIGFAGGFRRSELVSLDFEDIEEAPEGLKITVRRSKTDQGGRGRKLGIPYARGPYCPVYSLRAWSSLIEVREGPIFRSCGKGGHVNAARLSSEAVAKIVKRRVAQIGLDPSKFSGHSLRSGFVTSAIQAGAAEHRVRLQTGHASVATMSRYIREASLFRDNPASLLF